MDPPRTGSAGQSTPEPTRLIQGATEAERKLLRSASADGPPNGMVERMLNAFDGLPDGSGDLSGHLPKEQVAARSFEVATLTKIGLVVLLGVAGVITAVMLHGRSQARQAVARVEPSRGSAEVTAASHGAPLQATPNSGAPNEPGSARQSGEPGVSNDSLNAELDILDVARAAADAANANEARRALDSYARQFPKGILKPEATVLRLAVLILQGDTAAAKSLGQALLANNAYKTYEPRIRSLLREIRQ